MKYFVVSDIHSFFSELKSALWKAGYRKTNKNHTLIVCGDLFDRGDEAVKVYEFLKSISKDRLILIRGNHEQLFLELLDKTYPEEHDFHNRTVDTFCQIANSCSFDKYYDQEYFKAPENYYYSSGMYGDYVHIDDRARKEWNEVKKLVSNHPLTKFIKSDVWKNYYELDNYIFTHSFIPVKNEDGLLSYYIRNRKFSYKSDWRTDATELEWEDARWGCPFKQYQAGLFRPEEDKGKTLVCGHWHTSDFFKHLKNITAYSKECAPIYFSKGIIGIDGGVTYNYIYQTWSHPQNVLVIENGICYDKYGKKLEEPKNKKEVIIETITVDKDGKTIKGMPDFIKE